MGWRRVRRLRHVAQLNKSFACEQENFRKSIAVKNLKRHFNAGTDSEFLVAVVTVENGACVKRILDVPFRSYVIETGFDGVVDLAHFGKGIWVGAGGRECVGRWVIQQFRSANRLKAAIADINFPAFDLLKNSERGDDLIVGRRAVPSVKRVAICAESRPAKMFLGEKFGFNRR